MRLIALLICAAVGFVFTILLYVANGGAPTNRLGYAVVVSVLPAVIGGTVAKLNEWSAGSTVLAYVVLFVAVIVIQSVLRTL